MPRYNEDEIRYKIQLMDDIADTAVRLGGSVHACLRGELGRFRFSSPSEAENFARITRMTRHGKGKFLDAKADGTLVVVTTK